MIELVLVGGMVQLKLAVEMVQLEGMVQLEFVVGTILLIEPNEFDMLEDKLFNCASFPYKYDMFYVNHLFSIVFHLFLTPIALIFLSLTCLTIFSWMGVRHQDMVLSPQTLTIGGIYYGGVYFFIRGLPRHN